MNKRRVIWLSVVIIFITLSFIFNASGQKIELIKYNSISELDSAIRANMEKDRIPGLQFSFGYPDSKISWQFGDANIQENRKVDAQSRFPAFSITKLFTATSVLQLVENELLNLDDPVANHLPYFDEFVKNKYQKEVTILHLLTHTSGLKDKEWKSATWFRTADQDMPESSSFSIEKLKKYRKLKSEPGTKYHYSNLGFILLAEIVKKKTGISINKYVERNIINPLDLQNSYYDSKELSTDNTSCGYEKKGSFMALIYKLVGTGRNGKLERTEDHLIVQPLYSPHYGYIGLRTTTSDLFRFTQSIYLENDTTILSNKYSKLALTQQFKIDENKGMGLGWHIRKDFLGTFYRHIGGGPGFGGELRVYENGFTVCVLGNTTFRKWDYANLIAFNEHLFKE